MNIRSPLFQGRASKTLELRFLLRWHDFLFKTWHFKHNSDRLNFKLPFTISFYVVLITQNGVVKSLWLSLSFLLNRRSSSVFPMIVRFKDVGIINTNNSPPYLISNWPRQSLVRRILQRIFLSSRYSILFFNKQSCIFVACMYDLLVNINNSNQNSILLFALSLSSGKLCFSLSNQQ